MDLLSNFSALLKEYEDFEYLLRSVQFFLLNLLLLCNLEKKIVTIDYIFTILNKEDKIKNFDKLKKDNLRWFIYLSILYPFNFIHIHLSTYQHQYISSSNTYFFSSVLTILYNIILIITVITLEKDNTIKYSWGDIHFYNINWPIGTIINPNNIAIPLNGSNYVPVSKPNISTRPGPMIVDMDLLVMPTRTNIIKTITLSSAKSL